MKFSLALGPVRHGAGVHALHEPVDEGLVLQLAGEDVVRHAGQHGGVGVRLDGNPPGVVARRRIGVLRIDQDELAAALLGQPHVVEGVAAVEGVGRIPAPHDDQLRVGEGIVLVAVIDGAEGHAAGEGGALVGRHRPGIGATAEHAEEARQQALDLVRLVQHAIGGAGIGLVEDRRGAVLLFQLHHLPGDVVERLVPGHALELALAAFAHAQHRMEQPLRRIDAGAVGAAAQAGTQLRHLLGLEAEGAALLIAAVVGRQPHDDVALLVRHQHVARTAVVVAGGNDGGELVVGRIGLVGVGLGFLAAESQFRQPAGRGDRAAGRGRLEKLRRFGFSRRSVALLSLAFMGGLLALHS